MNGKQIQEWRQRKRPHTKVLWFNQPRTLVNETHNQEAIFVDEQGIMYITRFSDIELALPEEAYAVVGFDTVKQKFVIGDTKDNERYAAHSFNKHFPDAESIQMLNLEDI